MTVDQITVSPALATVISRAGDKSGVDFDYLLQTAMRESSLNPTAKASTSSATGLFQFIESTWLEVLKTDGPSLGYGDISQHIQRTAEGDYVVPDRAKRQEILNLRNDPEMSADLAAAFTRSNGEYLYSKFGRQPSPGELYIAHFMGARGAEKFFEAGLQNPDQIAAELFPRQANANRAIFYDREGAKTIREVYQSLVSKHTQSAATLIDQNGQVISTGQSEPPASRYVPQVNVDFSNLYSPDTVGAGQPLVQSPQSQGNAVVIDPGAAFFAQLYNK